MSSDAHSLDTAEAGQGEEAVPEESVDAKLRAGALLSKQSF
jgi:hypothetical protein